ncbi:MAG: phosphatase PAP2 family protein [Georgenia sp.]
MTSRARRSALVLASVSGAAAVGCWWTFVATRPGQHVDQMALIASGLGRVRVAGYAHDLLDVVSLPFLAVAVVVMAAVALVRGRWRLALGVPLMVAAANLTTQLLKYVVLGRPDLGYSQGFAENTLPSGHTTVAVSVAAGALLVTPARGRWLTALLGGTYAAATGVATMAGGWHRASDVVAAVLVVGAWAFLAQAFLRPESPSRPARTLGLVLAVLGALGWLLAGAAMAATRGFGPGLDRPEMLVAYAGASVGAVATVCAVTAGLLLLGAGHAAPTAATRTPVAAPV